MGTEWSLFPLPSRSLNIIYLGKTHNWLKLVISLFNPHPWDDSDLFIQLQTIFWTQHRNSVKPVLGLWEDRKVTGSLEKADRKKKVLSRIPKTFVFSEFHGIKHRIKQINGFSITNVQDLKRLKKDAGVIVEGDYKPNRKKNLFFFLFWKFFFPLLFLSLIIKTKGSKTIQRVMNKRRQCHLGSFNVCVVLLL